MQLRNSKLNSKSYVSNSNKFQICVGITICSYKMGVGAIIFNYIGAITRWLFGSLLRSLSNKRKFTFKEYLNGPNNLDDFIETADHVFANKIIGFIVLCLICFITIISGF